MIVQVSVLGLLQAESRWSLEQLASDFLAVSWCSGVATRAVAVRRLRLPLLSVNRGWNRYAGCSLFRDTLSKAASNSSYS